MEDDSIRKNCVDMAIHEILERESIASFPDLQQDWQKSSLNISLLATYSLTTRGRRRDEMLYSRQRS
jgi:hypothetical protein